MARVDESIMDTATGTVEHYATRVRILAIIYFSLNAVAIAVIVTVIWRVQFFITLAQRSNIETLTLAIVFVLAAYYIYSTFRGFIGAIRMLLLNASPRDREARKQKAMKSGGKSKYVCFDHVVCPKGKHGEPIKWEVGDEAGKLGDIVVDGVRATYYPLKEGLSGSFFQFLTAQMNNAVHRQDESASLLITQWSTIDEDEASSYHSMVEAFRNLEQQLAKGKPLWPTVELPSEDIDDIGKQIRRLVPALRSESLLPDVEYSVEYSVPILPEPLGFIRLSRNENRADPLTTMGCAGIIMLSVMLLLFFMIILPPWLPSK